MIPHSLRRVLALLTAGSLGLAGPVPAHALRAGLEGNVEEQIADALRAPTSARLAHRSLVAQVGMEEGKLGEILRTFLSNPEGPPADGEDDPETQLVHELSYVAWADEPDDSDAVRRRRLQRMRSTLTALLAKEAMPFRRALARINRQIGVIAVVKLPLQIDQFLDCISSARERSFLGFIDGTHRYLLLSSGTAFGEGFSDTSPGAAQAYMYSAAFRDLGSFRGHSHPNISDAHPSHVDQTSRDKYVGNQYNFDRLALPEFVVAYPRRNHVVELTFWREGEAESEYMKGDDAIRILQQLGVVSASGMEEEQRVPVARSDVRLGDAQVRFYRAFGRMAAPDGVEPVEAASLGLIRAGAVESNPAVGRAVIEDVAAVPPVTHMFYHPDVVPPPTASVTAIALPADAAAARAQLAAADLTPRDVILLPDTIPEGIENEWRPAGARTPILVVPVAVPLATHDLNPLAAIASAMSGQILRVRPETILRAGLEGRDVFSIQY